MRKNVNPDLVMRLGVVHKAKLMRMAELQKISMTELVRRLIDGEFGK